MSEEDFEYNAKMRDINRRREILASKIEQYKISIMEQNRLNMIVGRPLLPTPWLNPPPSSREEEPSESEDSEEDGWDEDEENGNDGFDEDEFEDLEDEE